MSTFIAGGAKYAHKTGYPAVLNRIGCSHSGHVLSWRSVDTGSHGSDHLNAESGMKHSP